MQIPEQFKKIFTWFGQHVRYTFTSMEEAAMFAVQELKLKENAPAKAYFDDLTSGKYSEEDLFNLWLYSGAQIGIRKDQTMLSFLKYMRSLMDCAPPHQG